MDAKTGDNKPKTLNSEAKEKLATSIKEKQKAIAGNLVVKK